MTNPTEALDIQQFWTREAGDFLQVMRDGVIVCEVAVSVLPEGPAVPAAPARMIIKRFQPNEFRKVDVVNDFDGRDEA